MQKRLEPGERLGVGEHDRRDRRAVDVAGIVQDARAEALEERGADLGILAEELVDDVVARDRRRAVRCEGLQGRGLTDPDTARDRDRDGSRHSYSVGSGATGGSPSESPGPGSSGACASASMLSSTSSGGTSPVSGGAVSEASPPGVSTASATGVSGNTSSERSRSGVPSIGSASSARATTPPPSTRLSERDNRRRSPSTSMIFALTSSPCETTSRGFSPWCWASSEMCTSPSTPGRISTKAPKVTTFVTLPSTSSPSL